MNSPRVWDCFLFFNEFELLEIRLNELADVVDRFVLVEATQTFSGHEKPCWFQDSRDRFDRFLDRIEHVVVEDSPAVDSPEFVRGDFHQRNSIVRGLTGAAPDDIVMVSDVDEIPRASCVARLAETPLPCSFEQPLFYCGVDLRCVSPSGHRHWLGTKATKYADLEPPQAFRRRTPPVVVFPNGGWHFSYLGGFDRVREKIAAYAHQEFNRPDIVDPDAFRRRVLQGEDILGRPHVRFEFVPLDDHPEYLLRNIDRFRHLLIENVA